MTRKSISHWNQHKAGVVTRRLTDDDEHDQSHNRPRVNLPIVTYGHDASSIQWSGGEIPAEGVCREGEEA